MSQAGGHFLGVSVYRLHCLARDPESWLDAALHRVVSIGVWVGAPAHGPGQGRASGWRDLSHPPGDRAPVSPTIKFWPCQDMHGFCRFLAAPSSVRPARVRRPIHCTFCSVCSRLDSSRFRRRGYPGSSLRERECGDSSQNDRRRAAPGISGPRPGLPSSLLGITQRHVELMIDDT